MFSDCIINQTCNNCTVSMNCPTGATNGTGVDECIHECKVWDGPCAYGMLHNWIGEICYRHETCFKKDIYFYVRKRRYSMGLVCRTGINILLYSKHALLV